MFNGLWGVLNIRTKKYEESYPSKNQALTRVSALVEREGPHWGVLPISREQLKLLQEAEAKKGES